MVDADTTHYRGPDRLPGAYGERVIDSMRSAPLSTMRTPTVTYQWRAVPCSGVAYLRCKDRDDRSSAPGHLRPRAAPQPRRARVPQARQGGLRVTRDPP